MKTQLKPAVTMHDSLYFSGPAFRLAVSVERGRERVLFLRDGAGDQLPDRGGAGDLGFKVQRELRQGRDVIVLSGNLVSNPEVTGSQASLVVDCADLHVRPEITEATRALQVRNSPGLTDRLQHLAQKAVRETLSRLGRPCPLDPRPVPDGSQEAAGAGPDEDLVAHVEADDFIDSDLLNLGQSRTSSGDAHPRGLMREHEQGRNLRFGD